MNPFTVKKFSQAIVKRPCPEMVNGISSVNLGRPDYQLAIQQHDQYVKALQSLGLKLTILEPDSRYPDSTFVEDVALCTPSIAIITSPGAESRRGEEDEIEPFLQQFYNELVHITLPGTLDAGDVMMVGKKYYIGISDRTNENGADQLIQILEKHGMTGEKIQTGPMLHLKTGISYLENDTVLVAKSIADHDALKGFRKIIVPVDENYAANSVWINGVVLVPDGFPRTRKLIEEAGYPVIPLDVSEFEKLDGGLSCLSLRF